MFKDWVLSDTIIFGSLFAFFCYAFSIMFTLMFLVCYGACYYCMEKMPPEPGYGHTDPFPIRFTRNFFRALSIFFFVLPVFILTTWPHLFYMLQISNN